VSHTCPVQVCVLVVGDDDRLMCPTHWHMVPRPLQRAVWAAWKNGKGFGTVALAAAQSAAISAVDATLQGAGS
jgi:hypothetical protein